MVLTITPFVQSDCIFFSTKMYSGRRIKTSPFRLSAPGVFSFLMILMAWIIPILVGELLLMSRSRAYSTESRGGSPLRNSLKCSVQRSSCSFSVVSNCSCLLLICLMFYFLAFFPHNRLLIQQTVPYWFEKRYFFHLKMKTF